MDTVFVVKYSTPVDMEGHTEDSIYSICTTAERAQKDVEYLKTYCYYAWYYEMELSK